MVDFSHINAYIFPMIRRTITDRILEALQDSPVLFLTGARQTGKSTLVKEIIASDYPATYITFDDAAHLSAAQADPRAFLRSYTGPLVIDEVQRAPNLFLTLKMEVDRKRTPGRFILTGSANILLLPQLADALTGRMEIQTLWPFSQGEIAGIKERFIDRVFDAKMRIGNLQQLDRRELIRRILIGGYPEILTRKSGDRRYAWYGSYIQTILQRDVRDLSAIENLSVMPRLLSLLAARVTTLVNITELSNNLKIPQTTLKRYITLLDATFLIKFLPAWTVNIGKRIIKTPKLLLCDTGFLGYLLGVDAVSVDKQPSLLGPLIENFVAMELFKQITWNSTGSNLYHFRTTRGEEIDFILEDRSGRIAALEIKASETVVNADFKNIRKIADAARKKFHRGIVLYTGAEIIAFGDNLHAVPIQALWAS